MNRIVIDRQELLKTLSLVSKTVSKTPTIPIIENVKCVVKDYNMRIVSNNLEVAVSQSCPLIETSGDCAFCVNPHDVIPYIRLVDDDAITIEVNMENNLCDIVHKKGHTELPIVSVDDFPSPKKQEEPKLVVIDSALLSSILDLSSRYIGKDVLRPIMNTLCLEFSKDTLCYCATDSHIIITDNYHEGFTTDCEETIRTLIPFGVFSPLSDVLKLSDKISMHITNKSILFQNDKATVSCVLIEGNYPNFKAVIPQNSPMEALNIDTKELFNTIVRAKLSNDVLKFNFKGGKGINLVAMGLMDGKTSSEDISCECDFDLTIGFNAEKMLSALYGVQSDKCTFLMTNDSRAVVIKDDSKEKTILIMPIKLGN